MSTLDLEELFYSEVIHEEEEVSQPQSNCKLLYGHFSVLFHMGNLFLGIAFVLPQWLKLSKFALRGCVAFGLLLLTIWSAINMCHGQWFFYNIIGFLINGIWFVLSAVKHFPVKIPKHLDGMYNKIFKPLRMGKKVRQTVYSRSESASRKHFLGLLQIDKGRVHPEPAAG